MKQPHATKKGPGRRAVTKADLDSAVHEEAIFAPTWKPRAKIRKQALRGIIGVKNNA